MNNGTGAVLSSFGNATISGGFSSGWSDSYAFNNKPSVTTVNFSEAKVEMCNFIIKPEQPKKRHPFLEWWKEHLCTDSTPPKWSDLASFAATEPLKNLSKELLGLSGESFVDGFCGWFFVPLLLLPIELLSGTIKGKVDIDKICAKCGSKFVTGGVNFFGGMVASGIEYAKNGKGKLSNALDSFFLKKLPGNTSSILASQWDKLKINDTYKILNDMDIDPTKKLKPWQHIKINKNSEAKAALKQVRKKILEEAGKEMIKDGTKEAVKNFAIQTAAAAGFDYVFSIGGNVVTGLIQGKSLGEAFDMDNAHYGSELLKSVNKTIFSVAFKWLFWSVGCPEVGEKIGSFIGSAVNLVICEPFRNSDGELDEGWCAIAACAEFGGAVAGFAIALAICGSSGPIGWVVGLCIIVFAAIGYGIIVLAHYIAEHWEEFCTWISDTIEKFKMAAEYVTKLFITGVVIVCTKIYNHLNNFIESGTMAIKAVFETAAQVFAGEMSVGEGMVQIYEGIDDAYDNLDTGWKIAFGFICPISVVFAINDLF